MTENHDISTSTDSLSITRHSIFDDNHRLWGYELHCMKEEIYSQTDSCALESSVISVAASAYMGLQTIMKQVQKIMLNFDEASIIDDMPYALPPMITAVQLNESVFLRPTIPERVEQLKANGYLIAVGQFSGDRQFDPLYHLADIIAIPVIGRPQKAVSTMLATLEHVDAKLLVRQVDDAAGFETCKQAGANLFEGNFFKPPDTISVHKMTSSEVSRRKLLEHIEEQNPDIERLAETIQSDAAISFRLLTYLNSPAFGFSQQIKSIHHAIGILGWQKLRNWLRVILINDMSQAADASDLPRLCAQRGKFLELVAKRHDFWGFDPESLHLLGLFSLLDAMIGLPMDEIVTFLPIENKLKGALRGDANNEYLPLIRLARYIEADRGEDAEVMIRQLNLDRDKVAAAFEDAEKWVAQLSPN